MFSSSIPQHCIWRSEWSFWPWLCQGLLLLQAFESFFRHRQSSSPCFLATTAGPVEVGNCFHFPTANRFACHRLPTFDAASGWRKTLLNSQVLFQTMSGEETFLECNFAFGQDELLSTAPKSFGLDPSTFFRFFCSLQRSIIELTG